LKIVKIVSGWEACRTLADISGSPLTGDENTGGRKWDANVQWTGVDKNGRVTEAQADKKWMLVGYGQKWTYVERSGRKVDAYVLWTEVDLNGYWSRHF